MESLTQWWTQSGPFFPKSGQFVLIFKRSRGGLPLLLNCNAVSVAEYASISLNMTKCTWKCFNKLFWLCQGSEYAWSSYMIIDRLLKMPLVLNKPGFWIWHGRICKGYTEFRMCLIMAPYALITPEYASVCLNVPQYAWTWLNIAKCPWICLKMLE